MTFSVKEFQLAITKMSVSHNLRKSRSRRRVQNVLPGGSCDRPSDHHNSGFGVKSCWWKFCLVLVFNEYFEDRLCDGHKAHHYNRPWVWLSRVWLSRVSGKCFVFFMAIWNLTENAFFIFLRISLLGKRFFFFRIYSGHHWKKRRVKRLFFVLSVPQIAAPKNDDNLEGTPLLML